MRRIHEEEAVDVKRPTPREIRALRERLDMSVAEFARLLHVAPIAIYKWEDGSRHPLGPTVLALRAGIDKARTWDDRQAHAARKKLGTLLAGAGVVAAFLYLIGGRED
jgi:DNA-binding XRE family transcriptional regulator